MAATSHDFWLANLTPPVWKSLHMLVYAAYGLLIAHVTLGVLQAETSPVLATVLGAGLTAVLGLHLAAALKERAADRPRDGEAAAAGPLAGYVDVCAVADIPEKRARVVCLAGERVAVFRYDGKVSAISNVCRHQNGPLGEGKIIDGCVTCPWHGFQYRPDTGAAPPPFTEKVPTFGVRVTAGRVWVDPRPNPRERGSSRRGSEARDEGGGRGRSGRRGRRRTAVGVVRVAAAEGAGMTVDHRGADAEFYVGYLPRQPPGIARRVRRAVVALGGLAAGLAAVLVVSQRPFAVAFFEYGTVREFAGRLQEGPAPTLWLNRPGEVAATASPRSAYYLVAPGKHGAAALVAGLDGREVRLRGTLIYRGGRTMLEVEPGSVAPQAPATAHGARGRIGSPAGAALEPVGRVTLDGRIVDSKCYLGVMNPGEGKPHRDCAVRCIAGGIPPLLVVDRLGGGVRTVLLTGPGGRAINAEVLDFVAEPVRVTGELKRLDGRLVLEADPAEIQRLR